MDAEEQDRHELFLELFEKVYTHPECKGWGQYGLVIQAYGKRALPTLCWLTSLARNQGDKIPVRLVVVKAAFGSAGQRCSALRVLYVQEDIADRVLTLLKGAMAELNIGDPSDHATDLGPVIDEGARSGLLSHIERMNEAATYIASCDLPPATEKGFFVAPTAFEIEHINQLEKEHFGPILHIVRYKASELDQVIEQINSTGFGLTLGIHSRNEVTATYITEQVRVGNTYINRNQIGAVVGVQPFGGQGLSGTSPKAGGPHYIYRFATEQTLTINTTAVGGNASLLSLGDNKH